MIRKYYQLVVNEMKDHSCYSVEHEEPHSMEAVRYILIKYPDAVERINGLLRPDTEENDVAALAQVAEMGVVAYNTLTQMNGSIMAKMIINASCYLQFVMDQGEFYELDPNKYIKHAYLCLDASANMEVSKDGTRRRLTISDEEQYKITDEDELEGVRFIMEKYPDAIERINAALYPAKKPALQAVAEMCDVADESFKICGSGSLMYIRIMQAFMEQKMEEDGMILKE